jgi:alpha-ketoglutarate-dependent sulfate ester dioxygenase
MKFPRRTLLKFAAVSDLPAETMTSIRDALLRHRVVFFRGQNHFDDAGHQAFARLLGPLVAHPTVPTIAGTEAVLEVDSENIRARRWHTDSTYVEAFPLFSVLRGVVIPPVGGDTVWANTAAAYATLPPLIRGLADQLWALHSNGYDYAHPNATAQEVHYRENVFKSTICEVEHPVVQVHPLTGERAIILGHFVRTARRQCGGLRPSVCHAAGSCDAAGKHGALALVCGRCGDLEQSRDAAQGNR